VLLLKQLGLAMIKIFVALLLILPINIYASNEKNEIIHFLNRLSFGVRPGELQKDFKKIKNFKATWLEEQMHPEKIDDGPLENKLHLIKSLDMEPKDNLAYYKKPEELAHELNLKIDTTDTKKDIRKEVKEIIGDSRFPDMLVSELQSQKIIRAIESKKQFQEVLVDFWYNFFNVDVSKNEIKYFAYDYENSVIRKNVFTSFKEMLLSSAHHPAMLIYLDNNTSRAHAINENYAREIMELHTLGVDAGYTQKDVQELARILTGWSTKDIKIEPQYFFKKNIHDKDEKTWLGFKFESLGMEEEGVRAIEILATHPKTAEHVCQKLTKHFFTENPEPKLIQKCVAHFIKTKGDFKSLYSELFLSKEFTDSKNIKSKIKKPFHLVISSIRALGGEVIKAQEINKAIKNMGEELYKCAPPTGYKDEASVWVNPGSMISRLQFSLDLTSQNINGVLITSTNVNSSKKLNELIQNVATSLGLDDLSLNSIRIITHELESESMLFAENEIKPSFVAKLTGLILGSPEFQRR
jgi:uncharacterized protein (DUF1800 family)